MAHHVLDYTAPQIYITPTPRSSNTSESFLPLLLSFLYSVAGRPTSLLHSITFHTIIMLFTTLRTAALGLSLSLLTTASALGLHTAEYHALSARTVWAPPITSPDAQTVWRVGAQETVRWDTSDAPADPTSTSATIYLGYMNYDGEGGENLDTGALFLLFVMDVGGRG